MLCDVISTLVEQTPLDASHNDHALVGEYKGFRECHIKPDWLLVYEVIESEGILILAQTGSHADLFE